MDNFHRPYITYICKDNIYNTYYHRLFDHIDIFDYLNQTYNFYIIIYNDNSEPDDIHIMYNNHVIYYIDYDDILNDILKLKCIIKIMDFLQTNNFNLSLINDIIEFNDNNIIISISNNNFIIFSLLHHSDKINVVVGLYKNHNISTFTCICRCKDQCYYNCIVDKTYEKIITFNLDINSFIINKTINCETIVKYFYNQNVNCILHECTFPNGNNSAIFHVLYKYIYNDYDKHNIYKLINILNREL